MSDITSTVHIAATSAIVDLQTTFHKVHLLHEQGHVLFCVGNITERKFSVSMFEFPTGIQIPEVCWKQNIVIYKWWHNSVGHWHALDPVTDGVYICLWPTSIPNSTCLSPTVHQLAQSNQKISLSYHFIVRYSTKKYHTEIAYFLQSINIHHLGTRY
jgi:hypothetical protein